MKRYRIRKAEFEDLGEIAAIEAECFPVAEAATGEQFEERFQSFGSHFYVVEYGQTIVGFINGMVTDQKTISDDLYEKAFFHTETGRWQSVFGLAVRTSFLGVSGSVHGGVVWYDMVLEF